MNEKLKSLLIIEYTAHVILQKIEQNTLTVGLAVATTSLHSVKL